jgi:multidrug efflux system outer membrane protein
MEMIMRNPSPALLLLAVLGLSGCMTLPAMQQSKPDLPADWSATKATRLTADASTPLAQTASERVAADWWKAYNDPALTTLIEEALAHNRDLQLAAARIEEMRANLGLTDADRYPSAGLGVDVGRSKVTSKGSAPVSSPISSRYKLNLQAAWEIDLWGRYRAASTAARADLLATEYGRNAIQSSLTSAVAQGYFALAALDATVKLTQETLANRRAAIALQRLRFDGGMTSELTLRQSEAEAASIEVTLAQLAQQMRQQELALAVLLGREPRALLQGDIARATALFDLALPPAIPAGLPSDLLQRRPDIRAAEQNLLSSQARIRETAAAVYPNLALTANLGTESKALADLFSGPAGIWGLAAGLSQTLFNAGRTEAALQAADARQHQALISYEQTVQIAFKEVLDALITHRQARETAIAEENRSNALQRAAELADLRFQHGVTNYLEVLDARRNLFQSQQGGIEARRAQLTATADLFKALGGGWQ